MNNPDFFPDLRLAALEKHAAGWAGFFESLGVFAESITLHFPPRQHFRGKKYLVVFRIKEIANLEWDVYSRGVSLLQDPMMRGTLFHGFAEVYDTLLPEGFLKREWAFRFNTNPMLGQDYPWVADLDGEHAWSLWPPLVAKSENKQEKQRRASSYDRDKARDIARRKWEGDETLTPHDIGQQIINLPTNPFRREYTERTITNWICDLRPGFVARKKGRIAKSKKIPPPGH